MKFVIAKQALIALINCAQNIVAQKASVPILSNFLLEASGEVLTLTATDLTVGVRCYTQVKVLEKGATTLPAKRFASLIKELTASHIEVSTDANDITEIVAGSSRFKLHGMNRTEFPALPDLSGAQKITVKQGELRDVLFRTSFAVSKEDNRYVLTGVFMQVNGGLATFVGTDGKRLSRAQLKVDIDPAFTGDFIIPLKAVEEMLKSLRDDDEEASLFLMQDKVAIESNQITLITKLLSGDYPDVNRVIPDSSDTMVSLHREELMTLLRQVSLFTTDSSQSVRFTFGDGELKLSANAMDVGEGKVSMPVNYAGAPLNIAFNPGFFLDILRHSKEEAVLMGMTDGYNPGVITDSEPATKADAGSLFVLMPMRLNEDG